MCEDRENTLEFQVVSCQDHANITFISLPQHWFSFSQFVAKLREDGPRVFLSLSSPERRGERKFYCETMIDPHP